MKIRRKRPRSWQASRLSRLSDQELGISFISNLMAPASWRRYEIHAAHSLVTLLKSEGIRIDDVLFDARRKGVITHEARQLDLLLCSKKPKKHEVACEFRDYPSRRVPVKDVEAFASKLKDVAVDKGVMLTPLGYERGAVATAQHHGIVLYAFREATPAELRESHPEHADRVSEDQIYWVLDNLRGNTWVFGGGLVPRPEPKGPGAAEAQAGSSG